MKRRVMAIAFCGGMLLGTAPLASAEPAEQSPIGGHTHHVHDDRNGGCRDIDQQSFEGSHRGLHRGAEEGQVDHGTCEDHPHN